MIVNGKEFIAYINSILCTHGFIKQKDNWYYITEECISIFHTSKSIYPGKFDHTVACYYKKVTNPNEQFPVHYKANVRYSTKFITQNSVNSQLMEKAFNLLDTSFKDQEREELIRDMLENYIIPFLKLVSTGDGIKKATKKYKTLINRVDIDTRKSLSI
jgi:hypothetical protein